MNNYLQESKRFLFVGGGTGGHLTPALGLAEALRARGHQTMFLTSGRDVEQAYLSEVGSCHSLGVDESSLPKPLALGVAMFSARKKAKDFVPDVVVSLGGMCGCAALSAKRNKPLVLLEGNRVVGKAVKFMQSFAETTFTMFQETAKELKSANCVGPIGRNSLKPQSSVSARAKFGLPEDAVVLLASGGSQGAAQINDFLAEYAGQLAESGVALLALCGAGKATNLRQAAREAGLLAVVLEHCDDMGAAYSAADFTLCRGGASTVAELWLHKMPAMIVPYPWHSDRQQEHNAKALGAGALVVEQLNSQTWRQLHSLLSVSEGRQEMRDCLQSQAPVDGLEQAVKMLEQLAVGHK